MTKNQPCGFEVETKMNQSLGENASKTESIFFVKKVVEYNSE